jgi:hypothetical protein
VSSAAELPLQGPHEEKWELRSSAASSASSVAEQPVADETEAMDEEKEEVEKAEQVEQVEEVEENDDHLTRQLLNTLMSSSSPVKSRSPKRATVCAEELKREICSKLRDKRKQPKKRPSLKHSKLTMTSSLY